MSASASQVPPSAEDALARAVNESWSARSIELAVASLSDTFAVAVCGMSSEPVEAALRTVCPAHSTNDTVRPFTLSQSYEPSDAAFVIGTAAHALDWDDYMHPMHGHCGAVLLAAAWATVAATGGGGAELVDAFLAGYRVDYLMGVVLAHSHYRRGWHATSSIGTIGAAASAARAMGLDEVEVRAALGIAASLAGGLRTNFGTSTKALHAGFAARHGIQAARLAAAGARSSASWLTGPCGMIDVMSGDHSPAEAAQVIDEAMASGLHGIETQWGLAQKAYSCCGSCHGALDAVIEVVTQADLTVDNIRDIEVHVDPTVPATMREGEPIDTFTARYSISWVVAAAAADRRVGLAQVSDEALHRQELQSLRRRVSVVGDLKLDADHRFAATVTIRTRDGRHLAGHVAHPFGHPRNPLQPDQRKAKQRHILTYALGPERANTLLAIITDLPRLARLDDLTELSQLAL